MSYHRLLGRISRAVREGLLGRIGFRGARLPAHAPARVGRRPAGRFVQASYTGAAGNRFYKVYVPKRGEGTARPLVVMLHGCTQGPDDFAAGTRMNELADELGVLVVYPQQARTANVSRCWNWFRAADQVRDSGEPSLIAGITREAIQRYRADPKRVFVAGLSAGGAMAAVMGYTYPDLYAAIGIHSGLGYAAARDLPSALAAMRGEGEQPTVDPAHPTLPAIVFHGDEDATVHPKNGERAVAHLATGGDLVREHGEANGLRFTREVRTDRAGKPRLEHWLVHGAGHAWSGGSAAGSYADPRGPDASREMLRFFLAR